MEETEIYTKRLNQLHNQMRQSKVDLVAIAPSANMRYLTGFVPHLDERFCALLVNPSGFRFVVPQLYTDQVEDRTGLEAIRWDDEEGPLKAGTKAVTELDVQLGGVLAVDDGMRADGLLFLQDLVAPQTSIPASNLLAPLRMRKSNDELEALAHAAAMADKTLMVGVDSCRPGISEREVAHEIKSHFRELGAEQVDFCIVASGPNGAFPHHETGDRQLQGGDTIIIDIGATFDGYKSDITRVVQLGEPSGEVLKIYNSVLEANQAGRETAVPGARAQEVDFAARSTIEDAGYGKYFVHRTGHGLGLEVHEPPWISSSSDTVLEPGMVFSIEPGVYLQDKFGVRIEDIIVVTEGECQNLTGLDHDMIIKS